MVARKDREAMQATGSTSTTRGAQTVQKLSGDFLEKTTSGTGGTLATLASAAGDKITGAAQGIALISAGTGMGIAKKDTERQERARIDAQKAHEAHLSGHSALEQMQSAPAGSTDRKASALQAFRSAGRTVIAHNNARRSALAAGHETLKTMSEDHTLGEATPIKVDEGTVVNQSMAVEARTRKDLRKKELSDKKQELTAAAKERKGGKSQSWNDHLSDLQKEKESRKLKGAQFEAERDARPAAKDLRRGYRYQLHSGEQDVYDAARTNLASANESIQRDHEAHTTQLKSDFDKLTADGLEQKKADLARNGNKFSGQAELLEAKSQRQAIRDKQHAAITGHVDTLKKQLADAGGGGMTGVWNSMTGKGTTEERLKRQQLSDQIARHEDMAKRAKSDKTYASSEFLGADDVAAFGVHSAKIATLKTQRDTGLSEDQQRQSQLLRSQMQAAAADETSGAKQADVEARTSHQQTVDRFRFIKKQGLTPERHDAMLKNESRLLQIKAEKKEGLTESDKARLASISQERTDMKGLVKHTKKYVAQHEGEVVKGGRAGGVSRDYNATRAVTTRTDALAEKLNSGASSVHTGGTVLKANIADGQKALAEGNHQLAQAIGAMKVAHVVGDTASAAFGGPAISTTSKLVGNTLQAGANVVGGATEEGADKANFARNARSMMVGADGKTDRFHQVQNSVLDLHGPSEKPFEGGIGKGLAQLTSLAHSQFGDKVSTGLSDAVKDSDAAKKLTRSVAGATESTLHAALDSDAGQSVKNTVSDQSERLNSLTKRGTDAVDHVASQVTDKVHGATDQLTDGLTAAGSKVAAPFAGGIHDQAAAIGDKVNDSVTEQASKISDKAHGLSDQVADVTGRINKVGSGDFSEITDAVTDKINEQIDSGAKTIVDTGSDQLQKAFTGLDRKKPKLTERRKKTASVDPDHGSMNRLFAEKGAKTASVDPDHGSMNRLFAEKGAKTAPVGPEHGAMNDLFADKKRQSHLAQIREAGAKSTDRQADKTHEASAPVSDVTKKEFNSWRQRIPRFGRNMWQRTKNFGKRMWKGVTGFFGR